MFDASPCLAAVSLLPLLFRRWICRRDWVRTLTLMTVLIYFDDQAMAPGWIGNPGFKIWSPFCSCPMRTPCPVWPSIQDSSGICQIWLSNFCPTIWDPFLLQVCSKFSLRACSIEHGGEFWHFPHRWLLSWPLSKEPSPQAGHPWHILQRSGRGRNYTVDVPHYQNIY